jgi:hypothetical protein
MKEPEKPALATISVVISILFGTLALINCEIVARAIPFTVVSLLAGWLALKHHKTAALVGMTLSGLGGLFLLIQLILNR